MEIGGPCEPLFDWTLLAIRKPCPTHGSIRYDVQYGRQRLFNVCPLCYRDKSRKRRKRSYKQQQKSGVPVPPYSPGFPDYDIGHPDFWRAEYDRNIDKFWAARGMTDADAILKFNRKTVLLESWS